MAARTTKPKPASKSPRSPAPASPTKATAKSKKAAPKTKPAKAKPAAKGKARPAPKAEPKSAPSAKQNFSAKPASASKSKSKPAAKPKAKSKPAAKAKSKPAKVERERAPKSGPAREALKALAMKKVIAEVITPLTSGSAVVDAYMRDVDHPFKAEMEAVRSIILGASPKIAERIKWNAPSFFYKEDLGAFHPRATEYAHLILLFPNGAGIPAKSTLLEGKQKDRREAKFYSLADIETKRPALEKLVRAWVALRDA